MNRSPVLAALVLASALVLSACGAGHVAKSAAVQTTKCPTTFGAPSERVLLAPRTMIAPVTRTVAQGLRYYVGSTIVLGPAGWKCQSEEGADGSSSIALHPASGGQASAVTVSEIPACQGCMADLACPFFPAAEAQLGYSSTCTGRVPARERITRLGRNVVSFVDPPGVRGNGVASGGKNSAHGLVIFLPGYKGRGDDASLVSCTLPPANPDLCTPILDDYLARIKAAAGKQFNARWPKPAAASVGTAGASAGATQPGYLAKASNGVLFIQWTRTGNTVQGTLSESYVDPSTPTQATNESHSFTGVISGSSITLTLDGGTNWNGTLTKSGVTLSFTASDGTLRTFAFNRATVADYNGDVSTVAAGAGATANAQAQSQARQQAQQTLDTDANSVVSDMSSASNGMTALANDLAHVPTDLTQMRSDLATQKSALEHLLSARASGCQNGGDYQVASTDNYQVTSSDDYQITSSDEYDISNDQQTVSGALSSLRSDSQRERTDQTALPTYTPANLPSLSAIQLMLRSGAETLKSSRTTWAQYLATVKRLDATSNSYATQANHACGG